VRFATTASGSWATVGGGGGNTASGRGPWAVLDKVAGLSLVTWNYKDQDDSIRHMGPMAQDFYAAFGLGLGEKTIDTIDTNGVALAAIQALNVELEELRADREELKARLGELTRRLDELTANR
jgi:hypothetical protein